MKKQTPSRRKFLKTAGLTTLITASGQVNSFARGKSQSKINSRYDFDKVFNRIGVNSIKWDGAIRKYGKDKIIVPMGIADMDFKQMPAVTKALMERVEYESYGYEMVTDEYYQSIIDWNKNRYGQEIKKEWIRNSSGLTSGMVPALRGLNPVGGKVAVMTPTYSGFNIEIKKAGMRVEQSPMKKINGRWKMDLEDLESRLDYETKCLILCNPNNPTGECWTADELRALGDVCIRHGVTVLSDEIWCDIIRKEQKYIPYASIGEKYADSSITYKSAGKTFNQAILKVAYFFTQNDDLMNAAMVGGGHQTEVNIFGQIATEVAYKKGAKWVDGLNQYLDSNFDYLVDYINTPGEMPGIEYSKPESTYLAWLDCNGLKEKVATADKLKEGQTPEDKLSEWLIEHAGVQLNAGHVYGIGSDGFLRMNIAVPRVHLKLALDNLNKALKSII
ncbi:MAG: PatB family C-S lyase [Emcibacteraceae bacterium]|nr:PatB family C-S lyase [Emcibacteraceae bacterium]